MTTSLLTRDIIANTIGLSHDGNRDTYAIYGWDKNKDFKFYYDLATETAVGAKTCLDIPAKCWANGVKSEVIEDELKVLKARGIFSALKRADQLNRMYKFSALYVGVPDGEEAETPLGQCNPNQLGDVYFQPFAYDGIEITVNRNMMSPRFGLPEFYNFSIMTRGEMEKETPQQTKRAHYSRVVHLAENLLDGNVEGMPYLKPIFKYMLSLDKVVGGAAEAYFRNARGKYSFEMDPLFAGQLINNPEAKAALQDDAKKFTNEWEEFFLACGIKTVALNTPHASPEHTEKACWNEISAYTGLPKRVLTGEGGGQYTGSEDKLTVNAIIDDRQNTFCEQILRQTLSILNDCGLLNFTDDDALIFPLESPLSQMEAVEIAVKKSDALQKTVTALSNPELGNISDKQIALIIKGVVGVDITDTDDGELE